MTSELVEMVKKFERLYKNPQVDLIKIHIQGEACIRIEKRTADDICAIYNNEEVHATIRADQVSFVGSAVYCYKLGICIAVLQIDLIWKVAGFYMEELVE